MTTYTTIIREIVRRSTTSNKKQSYAGFSQDCQGQECPACEQTHIDKNGQPIMSLSRCRAFRKLETLKRISIVHQNKRCMRCLKPLMLCKSQNCSQHIKCFNCNSTKHHPLLHVDVEETKENEDESSKEDSNESCNED